ncbi:PAS domain-containing hybrid sensor histidine kinase/response regulator [Roseomonas nepalensis]|uniref:histidine kinase n=1 Tax=Muricoccus nepalensis TaxID=1854500 RepID=A0A502FCW2_9PROT|nr:response regulator [Roseomonas nepalensis]TPG47257.1 PAS domain-containing hybrid sensor histidine kinase/response regulator [Roseomonas nepalensis]
MAAGAPSPAPDGAAPPGGPRAAPLSRHLMLLVAAVSVPLTLFGVGSLWVQYGAARQGAEAQLVAQARTMARLVDREFERAGTVAEMLAGSTVLARGDLAAFEREMRAAAGMLSAELPPGAGQVMLRLVRADGVRLLDTGWAVGERREEAAGMLPHLAEALARGRVATSDVFIARRQNIPLVAVAAPVLAEGRYAGEATIGIGVPVQRFAALLAAAGLPAGGTAWVLDRQGSAVATTRSGVRVGDPLGGAGEMAGEAGLVPRRKPKTGGAFTTAYARSPESRFLVRLDVPEGLFLEPLQSGLLRSLLPGALVLAGGLLVSLLLARRVVAAFRRVPALALARGDGAAPGGAATGLREADELAVTLAGTLADRLRAEAALRDSEARFRTLADAMPPMVWSARPDGRHDYVNARWLAFTGHGGDAAGAGADWLELIHPEDMAVVAGRWSRSLRTGEPYEMEARLRRHDGAYRWTLSRALPVRDAEGRVLRWFGASTDIQEIVEAREVVARDRAQLERLVHERTQDLEATQARLAQAQRMQALGQLAGGIAHDFNNVLQAVQGGAALIERRPGDAARVGRLSRMIVEAAERGAVITRRLLTFARRSALRAEAVDAAGLLADMREILLHTLGSGVGVELEAAPDLPTLFVDKGQLETVLINLGTNARDAMGGVGSLRLAAAVETVGDEVHPAGVGRGTYVRISVADTGEGMDAATLARASEPFFTTKPVGKGTGLGLSMARGFAEQSGGGILIESAPGRGTTIHLLLPRAEAGARERGGVREPEPPAARQRARLLLVDDDAAVREVTAEQLEAQGYAVRAAPSGPAALELIDGGWEPELVVSDLSMPGMDGLALIREIQRRRPGLPAILLTGFVTNAAEIAIGGALSGGFSLLNKPVDGRRLAERVAVLLEAAPAS